MPYHPLSHTTQHWSVTKPSAHGRRGVVVSQSKDAAEAGVAILTAGGNAVDAAVATALALAAVEPWNSGLGGVGFALVHQRGQVKAETIDFGPVAPATLQAKQFPLSGGVKHDLFSWPRVEQDANLHGPLSFVIPSAIAGYAQMHGRFGILPLRDVIAPAIALARRGLPQDWFTTLKIADAAGILRLYPTSASVYLSDGLPPVAPYQAVPGFLRVNALAETLDRLSHAGFRDFYEGDVAASIAADIKELGGVISLADLGTCEARVVPVKEYTVQDVTVQLAAGMTAGPTLAEVLHFMSEVRRGSAPDAEWFVALAEALKSVYANRLETMGQGEPVAAASCTSHLNVCDETGTMVAMTTTLLSSMGSRVVLPKSGVLMNNGVMWFDPREGHANSIGPGRRPLTNMCPVIVRRGDKPVLALGASGGRRILASVAQMLAFVIDFDMEPEAAAHHPRIDVSSPDVINADGRFAADIIASLRSTGPVAVLEHGVMPLHFACPSLILQHEGARTGVSDVMSPWSAAIAQQ